VVSAGTAAGLLAPPLAGRLVDRVGPRPVVIGAHLLQAAGAATYLLADGVTSTLVAAILLAAGQQGFYSALFALIADVSPPGPKDRSYAQVNMVRSGAFGTGALVAGLLLTGVDVTGLRVAVAVNAATFLVSAALLAGYVRDHHQADLPDRHHDSPRGVLRDRPYLALIGVSCLVALVTDFFLVGMPVYALEVLHTTGWLPGAMVAVVTALGTALGTAAVRATAGLGRLRAMAVGSALYLLWCLTALAAVVVPDAWQPLWLLGTIPVLASGTLMFGPRANALAEAAAPRETRGRHLAAFQYAFTVAGIVAPGVVALFTLGVWVPWALVGGTTLVGLVGLRWLATRLPASRVGEPLARFGG
jgi:MFS family permease